MNEGHQTGEIPPSRRLGRRFSSFPCLLFPSFPTRDERGQRRALNRALAQARFSDTSADERRTECMWLGLCSCSATGGGAKTTIRTALPTSHGHGDQITSAGPQAVRFHLDRSVRRGGSFLTSDGRACTTSVRNREISHSQPSPRKNQ